MGVQIKVNGDIKKMLEKIKAIENVDFTGILNAVAESLRTGMIDRFQTGISPDGDAWKESIRAKESGGKTLIDTGSLMTKGIEKSVSATGLAVGTNDIRAATLQFGDTRTIRAKNVPRLKFKVAGQWRSAEEVTVTIPARPFIGVSKDDEADIKEMLESAIEEA